MMYEAAQQAAAAAAAAAAGTGPAGPVFVCLNIMLSTISRTSFCKPYFYPPFV